MSRYLLRSLVRAMARSIRSLPQDATRRRWALIADLARERAPRRRCTGSDRAPSGE